MELISNTRNDLVSKKFGNWQLDLADHELIGSSRYKASFGRGPDDPFTYEMFRDSIHPDDRQRLEETFRHAIEQIGDYETDCRCIWPDGSLHWINAWGLVIGDKGKATRMIGFTLDITERKRAEDDLRRNRDTFYNLVANSPLGVYVVDSEFKLRVVSAGGRQVFSGVQPLIGRDFAEVLRIAWTEPFASQVIALFRHTLESGEPYHAPDTTEQRRDVMEVQSYDWRIERITLPDDKYGVVCYFFDMTERVRSQRLLAEQKRLLEMVVSDSSLGKCLDDLTESVTRLHPAARAGVLTAGGDGTQVGDVYAARFPPAFTEAMRGAPLNQILSAASFVREGMHAASGGWSGDRWSAQWASLCLRQGIRAVHSTPIFNAEGRLAALFILTLSEERAPNEWELRIAGFGAHIASIALERDRSIKTLYEHRQHLADDLDAMTRLQTISTQLVQGNDMQALLRAILAAAVELTGTDRGNVWLCNSDTGKLALEMHQGFGPRFLEYFKNVLPIVCKVTADRMERVIWEDVANSPLLQGTRDLQVLLEEGVRALQCTPLISRDGRRLLGLLNTHFDTPKMPAEQELRSIDLLARMAADSIDRYFAEAALRESQQRYRTLFESIDEGFGIIQMIFDERENPVDYRFIQINPAFERETGLKGALGRTMSEMVPNHDRYMVEIYGRVALTGEAVRFENYSESLQRWFSVFAFPADHGRGQVGLLFSNITERKRAEQAIRYHSKEIESLLDAAPLAVYLLDSELRIREMNPIARSAFGDVPGGVIGRGIDEIMRLFLEKQEADELVRIFRHTLETGEPYFAQERAITLSDGEAVEYYEGRLHRITLPDGRYGIVSYFRNISKHVQVRKEIERSRDMLREIDRRKDEFLAMLAHELRNPLAPILNASQVLRHAGGDARTIAAASAVVQRQVSQMVRLVDDLLDVSRITRGKIELRKERTELKSAVKLAVEAVRPLCKSLEHKLTVTLPEQPVYLNADPARLTQIIGNLLNNSCKFTGKGGCIRLAAELADGYVVIRVRDNGVGIALDQLPRIFEMFTQVDQSLERPQTGLGIGLTLVKNLVEMHDGTVEARSEGIGRGSEFIVRLPVMDGLSGSKRQETAVSGHADAVHRRVLLVDDNRDLTESLAMLLQMTGHEVHVAADGLEGVSAAAEFQPDVVLLDIGLPKLNGYETARRIREQQRDKPAFLVAMTGWGQEEDRRRSREAGFNAHVVKPVDPDTLTQLLAGLDPAGPGGLSPRINPV